MDTQSKLSVEQILYAMAEKQAADLHLSVGSPPMLRLRGKLVAMPGQPPITKAMMESFVETVLDTQQEKILEQKKEMVLAFQLNQQARFRINIFYQKGVLAAYLRLIGNEVIPLNKLGLPTSIELLAGVSKGLVVISGSFGSGKTSTSASLIDHINKTRSAYILTIERPIEHIFSSRQSIIEQREVGTDALSFTSALQTITQEDIDIIYITELSSPEVISQILNIAASGRLVIANIEADTTVRTLENMINSFPSNEQHRIREQLASNLAGIVCQRLITRVGGGQVPVAEIVIGTPAIQALIKDGSLYQINTVIQTSREEGMISLDWSLAELVKTNEISLDDALANASDPQQLKYMLQA